MSLNIVFLDTKTTFGCGELVRGRFAIQGAERVEYARIVCRLIGERTLRTEHSSVPIAHSEFCNISCLIDKAGGVFAAGEQREFEFRFVLPRCLPLSIWTATSLTQRCAIS